MFRQYHFIECNLKWILRPIIHMILNIRHLLDPLMQISQQGTLTHHLQHIGMFFSQTSCRHFTLIGESIQSQKDSQVSIGQFVCSEVLTSGFLQKGFQFGDEVFEVFGHEFVQKFSLSGLVFAESGVEVFYKWNKYTGICFMFIWTVIEIM